MKRWEKSSVKYKLIIYKHCLTCVLLTWTLSSLYFRVNLKCTKLSKYIWSLKNQHITPIVKWRIAKKVNTIFHQISANDCNLIKKRSELVSKCRHKSKLLLCNVKRNDSMDWCFHLYFVFIFNIFFLTIFRQNSENTYHVYISCLFTQPWLYITHI